MEMVWKVGDVILNVIYTPKYLPISAQNMGFVGDIAPKIEAIEKGRGGECGGGTVVVSFWGIYFWKSSL